MDKKTVKDWAVMEGILPRTAQYARERVGNGENVGGYWFLSKSEWSAVKSAMRLKKPLKKIRG